jgi:hypothetical protein
VKTLWQRKRKPRKRQRRRLKRKNNFSVLLKHNQQYSLMGRSIELLDREMRTRWCPRHKGYFKTYSKHPISCPDCYLPRYKKRKDVAD